MKYFFLITIFVLFSGLKTTQAQHNLDPEKQYATFGLLGGVNFLNHSSNLPLIPGSPDCGTFQNGDNIGYYFGLSGGYVIINNLLSVDIRLSYDYRPADFKEPSSFYVIFDPESDSYTMLEIDNFNSSSLTYLNFDIGVKVLPLASFPMFLRASFDAGNPLFGADYVATQRVVSPESALFPSGKKERNIAEGEFNTAGTAMGVSLTFGFEFELQENFYIAPELSYRYGLNSVLSDYDWKTNIIRAGLTAFWAIPVAEKTKKVEPEIEIPEPEEEEIIITQKPVEKKIVEPPKDLIKSFSIGDLNLTETIVTQTYPLLLYLFFDEKSDELPAKYKSRLAANEFDEHNLPTNTLDIYYKVLDIIGKRMNNNHDAKITITGTSDGKELEDVTERLALAERRANAVKNYLVNKWNITPDRIKIKTQDKPDLPTSEAYAEGFEENRRVEISSDSPEILAPVIHSKFFEYSTTQEILSANVELNDSNVTSWTLSFTDDNDNEIYKMTGSGAPQKQIPLQVNQILVEEAGKAIKSNYKIRTALTVENQNGKKDKKQDELNINLSKNQFEVGRLNLIVFDFDKYDISSLNKKLIVDFVKTSIKENSIVKIRGGTDRLGERDYNKKLSRDRANAVKNYLLKINPDINISEVEGTGDEHLQYDNNLPEGRFYCRTVMIEIKTPIK